MEVTRREFLRMAGASAVGTVLFAGCAIPTRELLVQSPALMPEDMVAGFDTWYASLCRLCPGTEGIVVRVMEGRARKIEGNPDYPVNQGGSSARCQAGLQALYHPDRIQGPMRRQGDGFVPVSWDEALDELIGRLRAEKDAGNGDRVLLITEPLRGHLGKLVKAFTETYGARHMAFEALEETALRQAVRQVFGQERLPDPDIANARTLFNFGSDLLGTWVSPVRFARAYGDFRQRPDRQRGYFVQVEPRMSMTAANADEWVHIKPGAEGALALSMAYVIISDGLAKSQAAVDALTNGRGAAALQAFAPESVAARTGVAADRIHDLAHRFATETPSIALGGGSAAAHTNGLDSLQAIYSLNYLVDSVGKPGGLIFNPAFPLSDIPSTAAGASFDEWRNLAGRLQSGQVNLAIVRGANPVYGLPQATEFTGALRQAGYLVSFSSYMDETTALADLVLPQHTHLEDWGDDVPDVGPGYQTLGIQQPVVKPLFDTRSFANVLLAAAQELGMETDLPWDTFEEMLREGARRLYEADRPGMVLAADYEGFWRGLLMRGGWWDIRATSQDDPINPPPLPSTIGAPEFSAGDYHLMPFPHISLTDGQGAHLLWLQATPDPLTTIVWKSWVEMNTRTAEGLGLRLGDVVELVTSEGRTLKVPVYPHPAAPPDVLSVPVGQGHTTYTQYAEGRGGNVLAILAGKSDGGTGALAWAATRVQVRPTGHRVLMTRAEGIVPALEPEGVDIVQVTHG